jgi:hypothetical protein
MILMDGIVFITFLIWGHLRSQLLGESLKY